MTPAEVLAEVEAASTARVDLLASDDDEAVAATYDREAAAWRALIVDPMGVDFAVVRLLALAAVRAGDDAVASARRWRDLAGGAS